MEVFPWARWGGNDSLPPFQSGDTFTPNELLLREVSVACMRASRPLPSTPMGLQHAHCKASGTEYVLPFAGIPELSVSAHTLWPDVRAKLAGISVKALLAT